MKCIIWSKKDADGHLVHICWKDEILTQHETELQTSLKQYGYLDIASGPISDMVWVWQGIRIHAAQILMKQTIMQSILHTVYSL